MTTWTGVDDKTTLWNQKGYPVDKILAESQEDLLLEDSTEIGPDYRDWETDRKSTRLNSSHSGESRMPSSG